VLNKPGIGAACNLTAPGACHSNVAITDTIIR